MALQLGALRDALEQAGADGDPARKAAEEYAGCQNDMTALKLDLADVALDRKLLKWMVTFAIAPVVLVLGERYGEVG